MFPLLKLNKYIPGLSASPSVFALSRLEWISLNEKLSKNEKGKGILNGSIPAWGIDECEWPSAESKILYVENIAIRCPRDPIRPGEDGST